MKWIKRISIFVAVVFLGLAAILGVRTAMFRSKQLDVKPAAPIGVNAAEAAARFGRALQFKTISHQVPALFDPVPFREFHAFVEQTFPQVHAKLTREIVADYSMLYTWTGSDPSLKPVILMGHMDVVPVEAGTEDKWTRGAFSGEQAEGFIWGRGALDDKISVMGILEAVEALVASGFQPKRTFYFSFGHDEEIGGRAGAAAISKLLESRGVQAEFILDEGLAITDGIVPGVSAPIALVGISEKGYMTIELQVETSGGHSSMPPAETTIGILSGALHRLESNPVPGEIGGVIREMFEYVGPEMKPAMKMVFANLWLFGPLVEKQLSGDKGTNASMRTTTAITIIEGGLKENVLPTKARAMVNFRLLPGDTAQKITDHVTAVIADERVKIMPIERNVTEAAAVSDTSHSSFTTLSRTLREVYPGIVVAPSLLTGGTDTRHFTGISKQIYRFAPSKLAKEDLARLHGVNERILEVDYQKAIEFYAQLIRNASE